VTHAQTWASYSALYRFGRLSNLDSERYMAKACAYLCCQCCCIDGFGEFGELVS